MLSLAAVNWHSFFFLLFALVACAFSLAVVFCNNIVRMAFYLILALAATAGLFMLAGAVFLGAMQVMIYVGGTLVLLVFGVMLTAQASTVSLRTSADSWVLAAGAGGVLLYLLAAAALSVPGWQVPEVDPQMVQANQIETATPLGFGLLGVRVDKNWESDQVLQRGMSGYLLPFEIVSVHLLVVLIGAAYLARPRRRSSGT